MIQRVEKNNLITSLKCWNVFLATNTHNNFNDIMKKVDINEISLSVYLSILNKSGLIQIDKQSDKRKKIYRISQVGLWENYVKWMKDSNSFDFSKKNLRLLDTQSDKYVEMINWYFQNSKLPHVRNFQTFYESFMTWTLGFMPGNYSDSAPEIKSLFHRD